MKKRITGYWDTDVTVGYRQDLPGFGVFLDMIHHESGESLALMEMSPKKARKLAKTILKMTKKGKR